MGRSCEPSASAGGEQVKAAEAKYATMAGTAEKLEATLKKLKGTAQTCQWSIDQLHRSLEKDKASDRAAIVMFVLMAVIGGIFGNFLREAAVRILDALGAC